MMSLIALFTSYSAISGQSTNWEKSQIFFGKHVSSSRALMLKQMAGMQSESLPFKYLGVPLFKGAPKRRWL